MIFASSREKGLADPAFSFTLSSTCGMDRCRSHTVTTCTCPVQCVCCVSVVIYLKNINNTIYIYGV